MADDNDSSSSGSDFDFEEDEEEIYEPVPETWLSYSWYVVRKAGRKTHKGEKYMTVLLLAHSYRLCVLSAIVYVGETLAWYLGITSPDWQYALDIHEDMQREAEEERAAEEAALKEQQEEVLQLMSQMEDGKPDNQRDNSISTATQPES